MLYTYEYALSYNPSMPVVEIWLGRAQHVPTFSLIALVDSGADGTIIPLKHLKTLQARRGRKKLLSGVTGNAGLYDTFEVSLRLGAYERSTLEVVADPKNKEAILGRDVLNQFIVTLNGLASMVEITQ